MRDISVQLSQDRQHDRWGGGHFGKPTIERMAKEYTWEKFAKKYEKIWFLPVRKRKRTPAPAHAETSPDYSGIISRNNGYAAACNNEDRAGASGDDA